MNGAAFRSAANNVASTVRREVANANADRLHIQLRGLPRTALPSDVQRVIKREGLKGVADVAIDYERFTPTGKAYLTLTVPDVLNHNLKCLEKATVTSLPITAASSEPPRGIPVRGRGQRGRGEATERGVLTGNGPRAGLLSAGKNVVIWGLPGKLTNEALKGYLQNFKLAGTEGGRKEFMRIEPSSPSAFSRGSKHLIRMSSEAEAHRMVRSLHMTYFEPEVHKRKYLIRASVIY